MNSEDEVESAWPVEEPAGPDVFGDADSDIDLDAAWGDPLPQAAGWPADESWPADTDAWPTAETSPSPSTVGPAASNPRPIFGPRPAEPEPEPEGVFDSTGAAWAPRPPEPEPSPEPVAESWLPTPAPTPDPAQARAEKAALAQAEKERAAAEKAAAKAEQKARREASREAVRAEAARLATERAEQRAAARAPAPPAPTAPGTPVPTSLAAGLVGADGTGADGASPRHGGLLTRRNLLIGGAVVLAAAVVPTVVIATRREREPETTQPPTEVHDPADTAVQPVTARLGEGSGGVPGFDPKPVWTWTPKRGDTSAAISTAVVAVRDDKLIVVPTATGKQVGAAALDGPVRATAGVLVDGRATVVWLTAKTLGWLAVDGKGGGKGSVAAPAGAQLVASGEGLLIVSGDQYLTISGGKLATVPLPTGPSAAGAQVRAVDTDASISTSGTFVFAASPATAAPAQVSLTPPRANLVPVRVITAGRGHVVVAWADVPTPTSSTEFTLATHDLTGAVVAVCEGVGFTTATAEASSTKGRGAIILNGSLVVPLDGGAMVRTDGMASPVSGFGHLVQVTTSSGPGLMPVGVAAGSAAGEVTPTTAAVAAVDTDGTRVVVRSGGAYACLLASG